MTAEAEHNVVLMAQLENTGGQGGPFVSQGRVTVSRSTDDGLHWSEPVTVFKGQGAGIGPANNAVFFDKEWITVDNNPDSPFFGREYVTATRFLNTLHGAFAEDRVVAVSLEDALFEALIELVALEIIFLDVVEFVVVGRQLVLGRGLLAATANRPKLRRQAFQSTNALGDEHAERKSTDRAGEYTEDRGRRRRFLIAIAKAR